MRSLHFTARQEKTFNVAGLQPANIIIPNEELRKNINGLIHRQLTVREA